MKKGVFFLVVFFLQYIMSAQEDAWLYLVDKENITASLENPLTILSQKSIDRKQRHGIQIDSRDVPVNEVYINAVKESQGISVMAKSKWFNALHVRGIRNDIEALKDLKFVERIDYANKNLNASKIDLQKRTKKFTSVLTTFEYGTTKNQVSMLNVDKLHLANYTGNGITIAVLDGGFPNVNTMSSFERLRSAGKLLGSYDFINRKTDVFDFTNGNHGTLVLTTMAGYIENQFVGTAPDASYYLFSTENGSSENPVEESFWVEAAERADSLGVDIINTSLGYTTYDNSNYSYSPSHMDGKTAYITKGANVAFEKGLLVVVSAGNSGRPSDAWQIVGAPADASGVLSIGAVDANGDYAFFSSKGNTTQSSLKPDVVAQGQGSTVITPDDVIANVNGTSFSSPILAGGIACFWQAFPDKANSEIMDLVRKSASQYNNHDFLLGFGIPDLGSALNLVSNNENDFSAKNSINVFPNPVKGLLYFDINLEATSESFQIEVFNVLGKRVMHLNLSSNRDYLDVSSLSDGIYILKMKTRNISNTLKVIKY